MQCEDVWFRQTDRPHTVYVCFDCKGVFDAPRTVREAYDGGAEEFFVCPFCGGGFERGKKCRRCAQVYPESRLIRGFCGECAAETAGRFSRLMRESFDFAERALLNELYDGEDF